MPSPDQYLKSLDKHQRPAGQPKPPFNWRRALKWLLLSLVLAFAAVIALIVVNLVRLSINPLDFSPLAGSETGRVNILVLGIGDPGHAGEKLSDTNMVISLNTKTNQVALISIPRDLRVNIPGYGYNKINEANALGGAQLAEQTVADTLGIPINYYVQTDFTGLKDLVDAVGGVDVNVTQRLTDTEYPCDNNQYAVCGLDIKPGLQHMDGSLALKYARCRKGTCGNDFGRAARQQEIISLTQKKLFSNETYFNPARWTILSAIIGANVKSDLSLNGMLRAGWQIHQDQHPISFVLSTSPGGLLGSGGGSDLAPIGGSFSQIQDKVQNIFSAPTPAAG